MEHTADEDGDPRTPPHVSINRRLSLDDAFADGGEDLDDDHFKLEFSTDAIRDELARQRSRSHMATDSADSESWTAAAGNRVEVEDVQLERQTYDPDDSVSTIDINALPSPPLHAHDGDVSPSELALPLSPGLEQGRAQERSGSDYGSQSGYGSSSHSRFPSVVIDVSKPPSSRVTTNGEDAISQSSSDPTLHNSSSGSDTAVSQASSSRPSADRQLSPPPTPGKRSSSSGASGHEMTHKHARSVGPSVFEQVRSKTRPSHLPPKAKQEDIKHLADWEHMMKQSRIAGKLNQLISFNTDLHWQSGRAAKTEGARRAEVGERAISGAVHRDMGKICPSRLEECCPGSKAAKTLVEWNPS